MAKESEDVGNTEDEKTSQLNRPAKALTNAEIALRRYEARLGLLKVVFGTFIVGLAGVLIPGAVSLYSARVENQRKESEIRISEQQAHQQYIKEFFEVAIHQDIELRIRFANYFSHLSGPDQEPMWTGYLEDLRHLREDNRKKINELEKQLVAFKKMPLEEFDHAEFDRVNRELEWANKETGYVPTVRSDVTPGSTRDPEFVSDQSRVSRDQIIAGINSLDDAVLVALACNPPVANKALLERAQESDPGCEKRKDPLYARRILTQLAFLDDRTDESFAKWRQALGIK